MDKVIPSKNQTCADNQQGRLDPRYIVGFTHCEGCFSISTFKNTTTRLGYQVFPEFVLTQGAKSASVLDDMQSYFDCGKIYENRRTDNHRENIHSYYEPTKNQEIEPSETTRQTCIREKI